MRPLTLEEREDWILTHQRVGGESFDSLLGEMEYRRRKGMNYHLLLAIYRRCTPTANLSFERVLRVAHRLRNERIEMLPEEVLHCCGDMLDKARVHLRQHGCSVPDDEELLSQMGDACERLDDNK